MAGQNTLQFTDQNFDEEVLKSEKPVIVDFWADWCAPCRAIAPTVEAIANEYADRVKVGKLNVDENLNVTSRYNIKGIPTLLLFKKGEIREEVQGLRPKEDIVRLLEKHL